MCADKLSRFPHKNAYSQNNVPYSTVAANTEVNKSANSCRTRIAPVVKKKKKNSGYGSDVSFLFSPSLRVVADGTVTGTLSVAFFSSKKLCL